MTDKSNGKLLNRQQVLALRGLRLPILALRLLREVGILCDPGVSILWRKALDTYVIRARESGGAVTQIGAYCGFASVSGDPLSWTERIENVGRNGFHALILAAQLIRLHVFRYQNAYDLLITHHRLVSPRPGKHRPQLENAILFHGVRGRFADGSSHPSGVEDLPMFDDGFGNPAIVPSKFQWAVALAIRGASCIGCNHSHVLQPETGGMTC